MQRKSSCLSHFPWGCCWSTRPRPRKQSPHYSSRGSLNGLFLLSLKSQFSCRRAIPPPPNCVYPSSIDSITRLFLISFYFFLFSIYSIYCVVQVGAPIFNGTPSTRLPYYNNNNLHNSSQQPYLLRRKHINSQDGNDQDDGLNRPTNHGKLLFADSCPT